MSPSSARSAALSAQPSSALLEASVAKIIGGTDTDTARRIVESSDTRLDMAGAAWPVMQVELFNRMVGHTSLGLVAARRQLLSGPYG